MGPIEIVSAKLLLVEGKDEFNFFEWMKKELEINDMQIHIMGGKDEFSVDNLKSIKNSSSFRIVKSLCIVRDADKNKDDVFRSLCNVLEKVELSVPHRPFEIADGEPMVGMLIIPPNEQKGALEDLCLEAIKERDEMECIDGYFQCLRQKLPEDTFPKDLSKARIKAFLASCEKSVPHLGVAVKRGYFPFKHNIFDDIKSFLKSL